MKASEAAAAKELKELEELRKVAAVAQEKLLAKVFAQKKAEFGKQFEHVWVGGDTEIKIVQWTMPDPQAVEKLAVDLLEDNLVSDCEVVHQGMSRTFLRDGKEVILDGEYQMICATGDDRLEELKKLLDLKLPQKNYDLVATDPITGNLNYFELVNVQTQTKMEIEHGIKLEK